MNKTELLKRLYYTTSLPSSYSSVSKLYASAKKIDPFITLTDVDNFLNSQITYTVHKQKNRNFKRNKVIVTNINEWIYGDLIDFSQYRNENNNYAYVLCLIDGFSKLGVAYSLKSKSGLTVKAALDEIYSQKETPVNILVDAGTEWSNSHVRLWCKKESINLVVATDDKLKSHICERFIKTLKSKIGKIWTSKGDHKWLDILSDVVYSYNHSSHRSIAMRPIDVTYQHRNAILKKLYNVNNVLELLGDNNQSDFKLRDSVRLVKAKVPFAKGYLPQNTEEIFTVDEIYSKNRFPMATVKDKQNKSIRGKFYQNELVPVIESDYFRIERILEKKKTQGKLMIKVRWLGYPPSFDSWILASEVAKFSNLNHDR